ncbi:MULTISPECIES: serine/threonine-protein kinase [Rhodococcus]|uniref:serine/threonine-protein kinase n=1 Tax=Rhodococcus TaxID=1827 RepID=UPI002955AE5E|nr:MULTISPECIES: serine/threonine-protein kinase [Rhodococcus]MDV7246160.1 serine/threonine-protein kinase [Rhodococcus oxybenzonivorans]MDV7277875.1 serine/threonine-protein kinase [Rhodococcus oxybenzonivorans]MDV7337173.1 serine/threonine-protein kinase [Rhodococcus oxybenzonivorans]MDV7347474.1 serine/threonine-protein kinase [Rhodococcus oxybenzonivorans]MDV8106152.1 serine/threonine-protein kinase [Rhodococcus sp. IEGM 69]
MVRPTPEATVSSGPPPQSTAVGDIVGRFAAAWESSDSAPDLTDYLPADPALRRVSLIELIKVDLEKRWRRGDHPKRLAEYRDELPELGRWPLPPDLIYEEFHLRRRSGQPVDASEYTRTFPAQADELEELLSTGEYHSTSIHHREHTSAAPPPRSMELGDLDVGQRVDDFDLMTVLGRGAFARVFLARQRSMQRLVAVKISEDHGTEPQTLAQFDHDYIVRVFDQRLLADRMLRLLYMQYVPGGTLLGVVARVRETAPGMRTGLLLLEAVDRELVSKGEIRPSESRVRQEVAALSWPETVAWLGRRLAEALDYAGTHGVLHRDIKPANVLLTAEGVPKLADFNISFSETLPGTSPVAYFGGSLAYMSPEQLEAIHPDRPGTAADLDTRSDLYSLAVVLWELLTGRKPFDDTPSGDTGTDAELATHPPGDRTTLDAMLERRRGRHEPAIADLPDDCPSALRRVLLKSLEPEPTDRFSTGAEMSQQFDVCLDAHARDLVDPPPGSWRLRMRRWTHPIMFLAIAVPNLLAILYSYQHNTTLIISKLPPTAQNSFERITRIDYATAFVIGVVGTVSMTLYLTTVAGGLRKGKAYDGGHLARARKDTLLLGQRCALLCLGLWAVTGIIVPATLQISGSEVPWNTVVHFTAAQLVCGAIAVVYPFFFVNFYAVRCLYPVFLPHGEISAADARMLHRLGRRSMFFLAAAAAVPLLGVAGATFIPPEDLPHVVVALRVLCVGSVFAFVAAYWLFRLLTEDLHALSRVVSGVPRHE